MRQRGQVKSSSPQFKDDFEEIRSYSIDQSPSYPAGKRQGSEDRFGQDSFVFVGENMPKSDSKSRGKLSQSPSPLKQSTEKKNIASLPPISQTTFIPSPPKSHYNPEYNTISPKKVQQPITPNRNDALDQINTEDHLPKSTPSRRRQHQQPMPSYQQQLPAKTINQRSEQQRKPSHLSHSNIQENSNEEQPTQDKTNNQNNNNKIFMNRPSRTNKGSMASDNYENDFESLIENDDHSATIKSIQSSSNEAFNQTRQKQSQNVTKSALMQIIGKSNQSRDTHQKTPSQSHSYLDSSKYLIPNESTKTVRENRLDQDSQNSRKRSVSNQVPQSPFLPHFAQSQNQQNHQQQLKSNSTAKIIQVSQKNTGERLRAVSVNRSQQKGHSFQPLSYVDKFQGLLLPRNYDRVSEAIINTENHALREKIYVIQTQIQKDQQVQMLEQQQLRRQESSSSEPKTTRSSNIKFFTIDNEISNTNKLIASLTAEYNKYLNREAVISEPSYLSKVRDEIESGEKVLLMLKSKLNAERLRKRDFESEHIENSKHGGVSSEVRQAQDIRVETNLFERKISELYAAQAKFEETSIRNKSEMEAKQKTMEELIEKAKQNKVESGNISARKLGDTIQKPSKREIIRQLKDKLQNREKNFITIEKQLRQKQDDIRKELLAFKKEAKDADDDIWVQQKDLDEQNRRLANVLVKAGLEIVELKNKETKKAKGSNASNDPLDEIDFNKDAEDIFNERYVINVIKKQVNSPPKVEQQPVNLGNSFLTEAYIQEENQRDTQNNYSSEKTTDSSAKQKPTFNFRNKEKVNQIQTPEGGEQVIKPTEKANGTTAFTRLSPKEELNSQVKQSQHGEQDQKKQSGNQQLEPTQPQPPPPPPRQLPSQLDIKQSTPASSFQQQSNNNNSNILTAEKKAEDENGINLNVPFRGVRRIRGVNSTQQENAPISSYLPSMVSNNPEQNVEKPKGQSAASQYSNILEDKREANLKSEKNDSIGQFNNEIKRASPTQPEVKSFNFGAKRTQNQEQQQLQPQPEIKKADEISIIDQQQKQQINIKNAQTPNENERKSAEPAGYTFLGPSDRKRVPTRVIINNNKQQKTNGISMNDPSDNLATYSVKEISDIGVKSSTQQQNNVNGTVKSSINEGKSKEKHSEQVESSDELDFLKPGAAVKPNYDDDDLFGSPAKKNNASKSQPENALKGTQLNSIKTNALAVKANKTDLMSEFDF